MTVITCTDCGRLRPHAAHGQCIACYQRRRRQDRPQEARRIVTCSSCKEDRQLAANGWCHTCYQRWVRHGRPADGPPAPRQSQGCGTDAAYQRHVKNGEPIDDRCRDARNAAQRLRRDGQPAQATIRSQWTDDQTRAAYTVALAVEDDPAGRRLLLEALGLAPARDTVATGQRAA